MKKKRLLEWQKRRWMSPTELGMFLLSLLVITVFVFSSVDSAAQVPARREIAPPNCSGCLNAEKESTVPMNSRTLLVVQEGLNDVVFIDILDPSHTHVVSVGEKPHEIELTPDGKTAFVSNFGLLEVNHHVGTPGNSISVLDVSGGSERERFLLPDGCRAPHGLKLRPAAFTELFTNTESGKEEMVVFDTRSGGILRTFPLPPGVHNFVFAPDGTSLYAYTINNEVFRLDPQDGKILAEAKIPAPRGLAWTADHRQLLVGSKDALFVLNPTDLGAERQITQLGVGQIFYPTASPDGKWVFAPAVLDGTVLAISTTTWTVEHRIKSESPLQLVVDGDHAWISNVLVPQMMLQTDSPPRKGGIVFLDLTNFTTSVVAGAPDANGIAASPAASRGW